MASPGTPANTALQGYAKSGEVGSLPRFKRLDPSIITNFQTGHGWTPPAPPS
ncbi:hypothetical protein M8J71_11685 [Pseudarthrobacter sp. R1]|uniref:hypothetical protein n=1 Tax=Pseudarthrobacter sp. R1 TaxID=2944934 RepID=UPI00210F0BE5|nr:hypothetical protein [Pseudarthrobacter sp. R1]MCQ6271143.1 hypothetical protein [Pseudarthrobacter sp. R1]